VIAIIDTARRHRAFVGFATRQFFVLIYLQKLAVGPTDFQISVPLITILLDMGYMIATRKISFSPRKLACFLVFVSFCLLAQVIGGSIRSIPSLLQLGLIYISMTLSTDLPPDEYQRLIDRFIKFMILPSCIILVQYTWQKTTGRPDFINMNNMLPKTVLLQGYFYNEHYPFWNSPFTRPNGFFFLEPSTVSLYTASAVILEATYFMRRKIMILLILATALSTGGTGIALLTIAGPLVLIRNCRPHVIIMFVIAALAGAVTASSLGYDLPLISRLNELNHHDDSGSQRLTIPAAALIERINDPAYVLHGTGAGSTSADLGNAWPTVKIINEYGFLTMVSFIVLFFATIVENSYDIPLKVALSFVFHLTGGYLVDAFIVNFVALLCMSHPPTLPAWSYTRNWAGIASRFKGHAG
jgi:hypothetical protein